MAIESEYEAFLKAWTEDPVGAKPVLVRYRELLSALPGVELSTKCRPGVSFSLRARAAAQQKREKIRRQKRRRNRRQKQKMLDDKHAHSAIKAMRSKVDPNA